jgi:hypothetical protein
MSVTYDEIVELDLGIRPEAAVSGAVCLQTENATFLTFNAVRPTGRMSSSGGPMMEHAGRAVVRFKRCILSRFGYPNDEARWGIAKYKGASYGIYEVRNSTWIQEVVRMNRCRFPSTRDDYVAKHFLFTFHDDTFECLADDMALEVVNEPFEETFRRISGRALGIQWS